MSAVEPVRTRSLPFRGLARSTFLWWLGALLVLVLPPWLLPEFQVTLLNYIGMATLVALGLVVMTGVAGIVSFGQQAFVGIAAYATAALTVLAGGSPWLGLAASLALVAACAALIGWVTLRLSGHYLSIATIAWGIAIYYLFGNLPQLGQYSGVDNVPAVKLAGWVFDSGRKSYLLIWACTLAALAAARNLLDSRPGRAIRALRFRAAMAESCGVDTATLKQVVFIQAALLAGLAGWLHAHFLRFVSPHAFGVNAGIDYLFMAVIGGASHVWGALVGASIMTVAKEWLKDILPQLFQHSGNYETIVFGVLMILLLRHTREGLVPALARWWPASWRPARPPRPVEMPGDAPPVPRRERPVAGTTLLEVNGLHKRFGGLVAVKELSFTMRAGEILGLIGPNGAGKSTLFNLVSGALPASGGEVRLLGERIDGHPSRDIARRGLARSFQHVHLVSRMSVLDNVALGAHLRGAKGTLAAMLRRDRAEEDRLMAEAARQIERVGLAASMHEPAGTLPLGRQRVVEIARALAADPLLLLLDEPAAGLRYAEKQALSELLRRLRGEGVSILLVEHDMEFVMGLVDRLVVMDFGEKIAEGLPQEITSHPAVIEAYLGGVE
jgi:ABC-type branched-subunit amino acid transport system ATPase component/ABC-type branched-subunit amino acid transport system permease subunit